MFRIVLKKLPLPMEITGEKKPRKLKPHELFVMDRPRGKVVKRKRQKRGKKNVN